MILFCDTSALVKLYVLEEGSELVAQHANAAELIAASRLAWVEAMSALARREREQPADAQALAVARQRLTDDWPQLLVLELTAAVAERAGDYADTFALRAYGAVQLASVHELQREMPGEVRFACFDARLVKAARVLGIEAV